MLNNISQAPAELDPFTELRERPDCYVFESAGSRRRILSSKDNLLAAYGIVSQPGSAPAEVASLNQGSEADLLEGVYQFPSDLHAALENLAQDSFNLSSQYFRRYGHTLVGGVVVCEANKSVETGLFLSRKVLGEIGSHAFNAGLAPKVYANRGRPTPQEKAESARLLKIRDREALAATVYSMARFALAKSLVEKLGQIGDREIANIVPIRPEPIAA